MNCNRSCSYCFAKEKLQQYSVSDRPLNISLQDYEKVLEFVIKSGRNSLQLAGGEPTLHPHFSQILLEPIRRGMHVNILSNALWNDEIRMLFEEISPTRLSFLLNIDHPSKYSETEWSIINKNLASLSKGRNVTLSFNIFEKEPDYDYIFNLVSKYDIKNLRLSFSMPIIFGSKKNEYIPLEEYRGFAPHILKFISRAEHLEALVRLDNTVPVCMFTNDELVPLLLKEIIESRRNFVCYPAIDIGPDLSVWRCFGSSGIFNRHLDDFDTVQEIYEYFNRVFKPYQIKTFPLDECKECEYAIKGICQGGCIGFSVAHCIETGIYPLETAEKDILESRYRLAETSKIQEYKFPKDILVLLHENGDSMEIPSSMNGMLDLISKGNTPKATLERVLGETKSDRNDEDPLAQFLTNSANDKILPMIQQLIDRGFIVPMMTGNIVPKIKKNRRNEK